MQHCRDCWGWRMKGKAYVDLKRYFSSEHISLTNRPPRQKDRWVNTCSLCSYTSTCRLLIMFNKEYVLSFLCFFLLCASLDKPECLTHCISAYLVSSPSHARPPCLDADDELPGHASFLLCHLSEERSCMAWAGSTARLQQSSDWTTEHPFRHGSLPPGKRPLLHAVLDWSDCVEDGLP